MGTVGTDSSARSPVNYSSFVIRHSSLVGAPAAAQEILDILDQPLAGVA